MTTKVPNFHKSVVNTTRNICSLLRDSVKHAFVVSIKTSGAISLKIWNRTLYDGPQCKVNNNKSKHQNPLVTLIIMIMVTLTPKINNTAYRFFRVIFV